MEFREYWTTTDVNGRNCLESLKLEFIDNLETQTHGILVVDVGRLAKKVHPFYDTCQAIFLCNVAD